MTTSATARVGAARDEVQPRTSTEPEGQGSRRGGPRPVDPAPPRRGGPVQLGDVRLGEVLHDSWMHDLRVRFSHLHGEWQE